MDRKCRLNAQDFEDDDAVKATGTVTPSTASVDADLDRTTSPPRFGNSDGRTVLDRLDEAEADRIKIASLDRSNKELKETLSEVQRTLGEVQDRVQMLCLACDGNTCVRNRFFARFVRYQVWGPGLNPWYRSFINQDNIETREGSPVLDAQLYASGLRTDVDTYRLLYGFTPRRVCSHGRSTIDGNEFDVFRDNC